MTRLLGDLDRTMDDALRKYRRREQLTTWTPSPWAPMQHTICHAVVAAISFDPAGVEALVDLLDANLRAAL